MKRVMSVYLPKWPLQRLKHDNSGLRDASLVLTDLRTNPGFVLLCSDRAECRGVRPGMPLPEALAIDGNLQVREHNPAADALALGRLATWLERFSPVVAVEDGPDPQTLLLDITGCADCFHGEQRMLQRAADELAADGWAARVAIAGTVGAAWGLAHFAKTPCVISDADTERALRDLPVPALRLNDEALHVLSQLQMNQVASLLALPRAEIPSRLGNHVLERLDQALGWMPEVLTPHRKVPEVQSFYRFEDPVERRDALEYVLKELTQRTEATLAERGWGARRVECLLYHNSSPPTCIAFGLSRPSCVPGQIWRLLRACWEQTAVREAVEMIRLRAPVVEPVAGRQAEFFEAGSAEDEELCGLIDRLSVRLGCGSVMRVALVPDPQPEYACVFEPLLSAADEAHEKQRSAMRLSRESMRVFVHRPLLLLPKPAQIDVLTALADGPPARFQWADSDYLVRSWTGPERIETGWWRGTDECRDYYMVTTHLGTRFWLFRRRDDGRWFLHGSFD